MTSCAWAVTYYLPYGATTQLNMSQITNTSDDWLYIPGHMGVKGDVLVDGLTKTVSSGILRPGVWEEVELGLGQTWVFGRLRRDEWLDWIRSEGHEYYRCLAGKGRQL